MPCEPTAASAGLPGVYLWYRYFFSLPVSSLVQTSESELPECGPRTVCNRVDTYGSPWVERQCRCPGGQACPRSLDAHDGHTVRDKWRLLKLCEPVGDLPRCRYFRDAAWTVQVLLLSPPPFPSRCLVRQHTDNSVARVVARCRVGTSLSRHQVCTAQVTHYL